MVDKQATADSQLAENLQDYAVLIEKAAANTAPEIIPNIGKDFSSLLMAKMFALAEDHIYMVLGDFCGAISDNNLYITELDKALSRGVKVYVIILGDNVNKDSLALDILFEHYIKSSDLVQMHSGNTETIKELKKFFDIDKEVHFSVIDGKHFRYEYDIKEFEAIGVFNVPDDAKKFEEAFKHLIKYTVPKIDKTTTI